MLTYGKYFTRHGEIRMAKLNELMKFVRSRQLWEIPFILSRLEKQVVDLIKLGVSANDSKLARTIEKRNKVREYLFSELGKWRKNKEEHEVNYSDLVEKNLF